MRWSNASEEISLVKSAMEVRLSENDIHNNKNTKSKSNITSSRPIHSQQNQTTTPQTSTFSNSSTTTTPSTITTTTTQSKVLSRVLEQHQSSRANSALNINSKGGVIGGLAPKAIYRQDANSTGDFTAAFRAKNQDINFDSGPKDSNYHLENIRLLVEKWSLRRQGFGHEDKSTTNKDDFDSMSNRFSLSMDINQQIEKDNNNSNNNQNNPQFTQSLSNQNPDDFNSQLSEKILMPLLVHTNPSDSIGVPMEVEFEISLQMVEESDENVVELGRNEKWIIWRTAKEILSLHAILVIFFNIFI